MVKCYCLSSFFHDHVVFFSREVLVKCIYVLKLLSVCVFFSSSIFDIQNNENMVWLGQKWESGIYYASCKLVMVCWQL